MMPFFDMHCHVLYGLDDGPRHREDSFRLIDALVKDGIRMIVATPHIHPGSRPFDREHYENALERVNEYCRQKGYKLKILPGGEIKYSDSTARLLRDGAVPTMNGTRFVLIEWSTEASYDTICKGIREISNAGYTVIIAHIERYPSLYMHANAISDMRRQFHLRVQIDCEAMLDRGTFFERRFLKALLKLRAVDFISTDAHDTDDRSPRMKSAYKFLKENYGEKCAVALTWENAQEFLETDEEED